MEFNMQQDMIKKLLAKGADMHAVSADGKSLLDELAKYLAPQDADSRKNLLLLADAGVFKGKTPPAHLFPHLSLAISERAEAAKA